MPKDHCDGCKCRPKPTRLPSSRCYCYRAWYGVTPPPPCPLHEGYMPHLFPTWTWSLTPDSGAYSSDSTSVTFTPNRNPS